MADMAASGWVASDISILKSMRSWGPGNQRAALVQINMAASNWGTEVYPGEGIPAPLPSMVGFREYIDYIIPLGAFTGAVAVTRWVGWGCVPPTYGVSGGTVSTGVRLKVAGFINSAVPTDANASPLEAVSSMAATTLFTNNIMRAHAIFVGK